MFLLLYVIFNAWIEKRGLSYLCRKIGILKDIISWRLKILREKQGEDE